MAIETPASSTAPSTRKSARKPRRTRSAHPSSDGRYAAKQLFQYRFDGDTPSSMRLTEERIVVVIANSASEALKTTEQRGRQKQSKFRNDDGLLVHFEFVGIVELIHLGIECESDEVWYDMRRMKGPMERKEKIIPARSLLSAFQYESSLKRKSLASRGSR